MILFPNCKINIGLNIVSKRPDGYHNLESIFYPLPLKDIIEITPSDQFRFTKSGLQVPGNDQDNLCVKAYQLFKKKIPWLTNVEMQLHKHIPLGSGLGGGSADGAFMLRLINDKFNLNCSNDQLAAYASQLGSDCPFFIVNTPCFVSGRGESIEHFPLDLSGYAFVLIHPGIQINTAWAFSKINPVLLPKSIKEIVKQPISAWKSQLVNDFERVVFAAYPVLHEIKKSLYDSGALYASMTGSGSSVYGIFEKNGTPSFSFEQNFRIDILKQIV